MVEPWLRGTWTEHGAVTRQVLHALELAGEEIERWCADLTDVEMNARPGGVAPLAFHLRHIARSLDRLLTYADARALDERQLGSLKDESCDGALASEVMREVRAGLQQAMQRVAELRRERFEEPRGVGRAGLPSTVGGLLVHCAEHTQRHVGQAITTAQIVRSLRGEAARPGWVGRSHE